MRKKERGGVGGVSIGRGQIGQEMTNPTERGQIGITRI